MPKISPNGEVQGVGVRSLDLVVHPPVNSIGSDVAVQAAGKRLWKCPSRVAGENLRAREIRGGDVAQPRQPCDSRSRCWSLNATRVGQPRRKAKRTISVKGGQEGRTEAVIHNAGPCPDCGLAGVSEE